MHKRRRKNLTRGKVLLENINYHPIFESDLMFLKHLPTTLGNIY
jgi:hypothetical protein